MSETQRSLIPLPQLVVVPPQVGANAAQSDASPILFRAIEAAALFRISERTWRSWDAYGIVPKPIHLGRNKYWRPQELAAWAAAGCPNRKVWSWTPAK